MDNTNYSIVIATANLGKLKDFRNILSNLPLTILSPPNGFDVKETGKTFAENARLKALACAELTGKWALADDSGLNVDALNGAPGVHSARYASTDEGRIRKLLNELNNFTNRRATFNAALCLASPNEILLEVQASCLGCISHSPRGKEGFGYDPIFEVEGTGLTFAEMSKYQKSIYSHRGKALILLIPGLKNLLGLN